MQFHCNQRKILFSTFGTVDFGAGGAPPPPPPPPPRGIHMRVHDRHRQAQSRSAKQQSNRKALQ